MFLAVDESLLFILVLLAHIVVVLVERLRVQLVSTIVLLQQLLFSICVHVLHHLELSFELLNVLSKLTHALLMTLLAALLDGLALD